MRYSFLHAADLHLDSPLRGLDRYQDAPVAALRDATRRAFENLVRRALELPVAFVILAGDVFDGDWKDFRSGLWFAGRLRELTRAGIRVYLLSGNHDAESKLTKELDWPQGVHVFRTSSPETVVDEATGAVLHGQGFARAAITADLASGYPNARPGALNIGVLHTALDGREGHDPYAPCSKDTLIGKGYDYWALGHVHRREVIAREPWIVFPGNLQARHAREIGEKGATVVSVADGRIVAVDHESFDVVRFAPVRVDASACARRGECANAVAEALSRARDDAAGRLLAARVELAGVTAAHQELIRHRDAFLAECQDRANGLHDVWLEKLVVATRPPANASGRDIAEQLELDVEELRAAALAATRGDLDALLDKLPPGLDPQREGFDLRDDATLRALAADARDDVVRRLLDAAAGTGSEVDE